MCLDSLRVMQARAITMMERMKTNNSSGDERSENFTIIFRVKRHLRHTMNVRFKINIGIKDISVFPNYADNPLFRIN